MSKNLVTVRLIGTLLVFAALVGVAQAQVDTAPEPSTQQMTGQQAAPPPAPEKQQTVWDLLKSGQALASGAGVAKDPAKAREIYEQVMASDDKRAASAAANALGRLAADELNDPKLSARAFDRGVELGDPWSMISRGDLLARGSVSEQKQALDLYLRALETDKTPNVQKSAYGALGRLYLRPALLSSKKAEDYLQRAVALGDPWALISLGDMYAKGTGTKPNLTRAQEIYEKVMSSDDKHAAASAANALGRLAADELNDPELSARAFDRGVELGDPWSMISRGDLLARGSVSEQKQARELYLRALETDKTPNVQKSAYGALGRLYLRPALLSSKKAEDYLQRAVALGDPWALISLGDMYEKGTGTKPNWTKARDNFEKALAWGVPQIDSFDKALASGAPEIRAAAAYSLAQLYLKPRHSAPKKALSYLAISQENGNPWATMMLADLYSKGIGVKKSKATALRLYTDLRDGTDEDVSREAAMQLGHLYSVSPKRDLRLAEENYLYASTKGNVWGSYMLAELYIKKLPSKANRNEARKLLKTLAQNKDPEVRRAANRLLRQVR